MSSAVEMRSMVMEAAETAVTQNWKDRVHAASRVLGLPFSRTKAFYYQERRVVTAEEMDNARAKIRDLREQRRREEERKHLSWLASEVGRLRESGEDFHVEHLNALEHVLRSAGREVGSVEVQETADGETR